MPENYYDKIHIETNEMRRKIMHKEFMSEAFIPIPTTQFYDEVHKRRKNNNALFSKEFDVYLLILESVLFNKVSSLF